MRKLIIALFFTLSSFFVLDAQVQLSNPSFEGLEPQDATMPISWLPCKLGTTPDILPGPWGVVKEASEGDTYLGLITRADNSWESITQRLTKIMKAGTCYEMDLDLARSIRYPGHNQPIVLKIYGTMEKCAEPELLYTSDLIKHTDWETYRLILTPSNNFRYLIFEAAYPGEEKTAGNILIDNIQVIRECDRA